MAETVWNSNLEVSHQKGDKKGSELMPMGTYGYGKKRKKTVAKKKKKKKKNSNKYPGMGG